MMTMDASQSNSDWLFITQSRVLLADWLMLDNSEKATLHNNNIFPIMLMSLLVFFTATMCGVEDTARDYMTLEG